MARPARLPRICCNGRRMVRRAAHNHHPRHMIKITGSVGKNGSNTADDVKKIQALLNRHAPVAGFGKLSVDGKVGTNTLKAIVVFQKTIGMRSPDGVIDAGGRTLKALEGKPVAPPAAEEKDPAARPSGNGRLVGNVSGVQADLVAYARAVAEFYGREIRISSGRRNNDEQAAVMFKYWCENLKRGQLYAFLRANPGTLQELDELYAAAAEGKAKTSDEAATAKKKFLMICSALAPKLSAHVAGRAIDVSPKSCLTSAMRAAMKMALKEVEETSCFHYETKGSVPAPSESVKKQWPPA
jgi:hypothetical protein